MWRHLILIFLFSNLSFALDTDKAAHFGVAYTGQTLIYGFARKGLTLKKSDAVIFSVATMAIIGLAKEAMDRQPDGKDILANTVGQGFAVGTILMFDF